MATRKEMSLRHAPHDRYTLVSQDADGTCVIADASGRKARVKAGWLDIVGQECWAKSFRAAIHIRSAKWNREDV